MLQNCDARIYHRLLTIPGGKPVRYQAGDVICFQGRESCGVVVVSGADIKVQYISAAGRKYTIVQEDNYSGVLGEMELFSETSNHMLSVIAVNPVTGYQLSRAVMRDALVKMPDLALDFMTLMSNRYHSTVTQAMVNILYGLRFNALQRLVAQADAAGGEVFVISQEVEAERLGTSSRAYRRILKNLLDDGIVQRAGDGFRIANPEQARAELQI
ncbi:Crp/Fnr family transcriptional regulator [Parendozoicomonas haliclonae]|uniref:Cyclic nucleotide-binding domain protein n=1 Tax=Parendozoicomonas haliclonae TaxID=1960125 RepID=A0A1X7AI02_9GAMM|nr:Crp/Fnr family transcriptional regulator [Parendozoicomonas haliclonae]SMA42098.1 Cyclic nucleotide-binding domain protein [Parendozoicomonas haliclonae]